MLAALLQHKSILPRILSWLMLFLAAAVIVLIVVISAARWVTSLQNHITSPDGIDEGIYVPLGGQDQYLLIRGENTENPVVIWLHGGPASPEGFANYAFQKHLVDDYTIINWDQRGCGRTYFRNAASDPNNASVTFSQLQTDLDALVDYACDRFGKKNVILVAHSCGTMIGSQYALAHPEKVAAYIGVGQFVTMESDLYSYADALQIAQAKGDDTGKMTAAYETFLSDRTLPNMLELRKQVFPYHKAEKQANTIWLGVASPYMGLGDLRWFLKQMGGLDQFLDLNRQLFDEIMITDVRDYGLEYQIPVGFVSGSCDWTTPVKYAQEYCDSIQAPQKQFHRLDGCGHAPQYDAPEEFAGILKAMLKDFLT